MIASILAAVTLSACGTAGGQQSDAADTPAALGLRVVRIHVADEAALGEVRSRFSDAGLDASPIEAGVRTTDPWGTVVEVIVHP